MSNKDQLTFWEHLDELRDCIIKICIVFVVCSIVAFFFKEEIFAFILAPGGENFITYELISDFNTGFISSANNSGKVKLINTGLASQFVIHIKTALQVGFLLSFPFLLYQLFKFVAPALHKKEKRYAISVCICSTLLFSIGFTLAYFIIFPFTYQFLSTYQVSGNVENLISLQSYIDNFIAISLFCSIAFEMPIFAWVLAKLGVINAKMMKEYRRHSIIAILLIAAIITPTSDIFTLALVSLPLILLYEISIVIVQLRRVQ
ncbi:MAG: twin-arginine translocase subunit TatC [Bacteroidales bacterium]|nr:twin-arginine translocase subunit TatC [Bacteroidales bacterium]